MLDTAEGVTWAVDTITGGAALLLALLVAHGQQVLYISSTMVNRAADGYRGAGKTDARDAAVIADQARMRRGLTALRVDEELIVELRMLVARRQDLVADRTRMVNRLREQLLAIRPALERALDVTNKGPLVLLTGYQRPAEIRRLGAAALTAWLRARKVKGAEALAVKAVKAASSQTTTLPGEHMAALLGAEFLAATGGDMSIFDSADHLAAYAGLAPAPRDSRRISGNLHRPRRYNRALNRVFYSSALISVQRNPDSRRFYDRKRSEGKPHTQAVLALARRRVNVLWALIRDRRCYQLTPPQAQAA